MKEKWTAFFEKIKGVFVAHKMVSVAVSCAAALVICTGAVTAVLLNRPADSLVDTSTSLSESDKELIVDESELDSALSVEEGAQVSTIINEDGTTTEVITHVDGTVTEVTTNSDGSQSVSMTDRNGNTSTVTKPSTGNSSSVSTPSVSAPQTGTNTPSTPSTSTPSTPESKPESSQPTPTPTPEPEPEPTPEPTPTPTPEPEPEPEPEYPPFDANTVINNAIPRIKQFMTYIQDLMTEEEKVNNPTGGLGYFTYTFGLDETMEEIEQGLVELYQVEHKYGCEYFYIEYAGLMHNGDTYKGVTYVGSQPGHWFFLYR